MDAARQRLGALEAEFIRSLSTGGPYARGLDPRGMRATSQVLQAKRVRTMARVWPELAGILGDDLARRATDVLAGTPLPSGDHAVQDGLILARHLEASGPIPDSLRVRMLGVSLHYRMKRGLMVHWHGPAFGVAYLRESGRFICALRVAGLPLLSVSIRVR